MAVLGNFFALYIAGQRVAMATSNNAQFKTEFANTTNKDGMGYDTSKPVKKLMSADLEAFFCSSIGNLLQFPEDISNAAWSKDTGVVITTVASPTGQMLGNRITFNAGSQVWQNIVLPTGFDDYVNGSLWVKGTGTIKIKFDWSAPILADELTITLSNTSYTRIDLPSTAAVDDGAELIFTIEKGTATSVDVFGPQVSQGAILQDYAGSAKLFADLLDAQMAGTTITIRHSTDLEGDLQVQGSAYVSNLDTKTQASGVNTFTCSLTGTATQTISEV